MTFPIAHLNLSASGGAFFTDYGVDYFSAADSYNAVNDNLPLKNIVRRTSLIAGTLDEVITFLSDGINGNTIRGNSVSGHSDSADAINTLEKFLAVAHNADGTIKKLEGEHPPVTPATGSFAALDIFVGTQKVKLNAGVGESRVVPGNDARLAYFDAVVAPLNAQSRVHTPGSAPPAVYDYYQVAPFVQGLTYYDSLELALDGGARRILMLPGTFTEAALSAGYDLGGKDLYVYGIEDATTIIELPDDGGGLPFAFTNGDVTFENITFHEIAVGGGFTTSAGYVLTLKRCAANANVFISTLGDVFLEDTTLLGSLSVSGSSKGYIKSSTIVTLGIDASALLEIDGGIFTTFSLSGGVDQVTIRNTDITTLTMTGAVKQVDFTNCGITTMDPASSATLDHVSFRNCIIGACYTDMVSRSLTFDSCKMSTVYFTNTITSFNFINNYVLVGSSGGTGTITDYNISNNHFANGFYMYNLERGTFANNYCVGIISITNHLWHSTIENNRIVNQLTLVASLHVKVRNNKFNGKAYYGNADHFNSELNEYLNFVQYTGTLYANLVSVQDNYAGDLDFVSVNTTIAGLRVDRCVMNNNDIGNITPGSDTTIISDLVIKDVYDLGNVIFDGNAASPLEIDGFTLQNCTFNGNLTMTSNLAKVSRLTVDSSVCGANMTIGATTLEVEYSHITFKGNKSSTAAMRLVSLLGAVSIEDWNVEGNYLIKFFLQGTANVHTASKFAKSICIHGNHNAFCQIRPNATHAGDTEMSFYDVKISGNTYEQVAATDMILDLEYNSISTNLATYTIERMKIENCTWEGALSASVAPIRIKHNVQAVLNDTVGFDVQVNNITSLVSVAADNDLAGIMLVENSIAIDRFSVYMTDVRMILKSGFAGKDICIIHRKGDDISISPEGYLHDAVVDLNGNLSYASFLMVISDNGGDTKVLVNQNGGNKYGEATGAPDFDSGMVHITP